MQTQTFNVQNMACEHCKANVEKSLLALEGVGRAEADLQKKTVMVEYDPARVDEQRMIAAVEAKGYRMKP